MSESQAAELIFQVTAIFWILWAIGLILLAIWGELLLRHWRVERKATLAASLLLPNSGETPRLPSVIWPEPRAVGRPSSPASGRPISLD